MRVAYGRGHTISLLRVCSQEGYGHTWSQSVRSSWHDWEGFRGSGLCISALPLGLGVLTPQSAPTHLSVNPAAFLNTRTVVVAQGETAKRRCKFGPTRLAPVSRAMRRPDAESTVIRARTSFHSGPPLCDPRNVQACKSCRVHTPSSDAIACGKRPWNTASLCASWRNSATTVRPTAPSTNSACKRAECLEASSQERIFVSRSAGFSFPLTLENTRRPLSATSCTHK